MKKLTSLLFALFISSFVLQSQSLKPIRIGDKAPVFVAESTTGKINFLEDCYNKWTIQFSHPSDFTSVCSSEILELAYLQEDFNGYNTMLMMVSTDGLNSHIEWVNSLESIKYKDNETVKIDFPIIADPTYEISKKYGMISENIDNTRTIEQYL